MSTESSNYKIQQTGDGQYEATVTLVTLEKRSKVFLDHDDAESWAQEQLREQDESDEKSEEPETADTSTDAGGTGESQGRA